MQALHCECICITLLQNSFLNTLPNSTLHSKWVNMVSKVLSTECNILDMLFTFYN